MHYSVPSGIFLLITHNFHIIFIIFVSQFYHFEGDFYEVD